ncbi:hypothetical protein ACVDFE_24685 [Lentzea chajnantorensis]
MDTTEVLGAVAHPGGLLVHRPELVVGVVRAISTPWALEIELQARRPLDHRGAAEVAPRRLLPAHDEGVDLRVAWLDETGHAHWEYALSSWSDSGDHVGGTSGHRVVFRFPPVFDEMSLVLAWPEIGFPETIVRLPLPDRATVERTTTSIWRAPLDVRPLPQGLTHHVAPHHDAPALETGTIAAPPLVLHRRVHRAAVVLTRLTVVGPVLSAELLCVARGHAADVVNEHAFSDRQDTAPDDPARVRTSGPGAAVAVVQGSGAFWVRRGELVASGGDQTFSCLQQLVLRRPEDGWLDLVVAWPLAGLGDVLVRVPLTSA